MASETRRFSQSEMKTFLRCKRKWWLSEYRRLAPLGSGPTGPLRSGTRVHTALEAFYTPDANEFEALTEAQAADWLEYTVNCLSANEEPDASIAAEFAKDCQLERIMVEGYGEWIAESGVDAGIEFIATEEIVTVPGDRVYSDLVDEFGPFDIVGKLDARVRRESDGARMFLDHKTAKSLTMALPTLQMDMQMMHYMWLESMTTPEGERSDGALYNVIKKVKRTSTAKPPFFARYEVHHNDDAIYSYSVRLSQIVSEILVMERQLTMYPHSAEHIAYANPTNTCSWECPFFTLCPMFEDGSRAEDMIRDQFTTRDPLARYAAENKPATT